MDRLKALLKNEEGSVIMLVALSLIGLLSITGLVIDLGNLFVTKSHLKKAANASVLSAGQELANSQLAVENILNEVLEAHNEASSFFDDTIEFGSKVSLKLRKEVPLTFSKLLGFESVPVEAVSTAQILSMGRAKGAAPIGIDESFNPSFGEKYTLKVDQTEVDIGNFGVLALAGPGAQTYEDNLRYGYSGEIVGFAFFYLLEPMAANDTSIAGMFVERVGTGYFDSNAVGRGAYSIKLVE